MFKLLSDKPSLFCKMVGPVVHCGRVGYQQSAGPTIVDYRSDHPTYM